MDKAYHLANLRPLILAGGEGTRLRPRTSHLPKPLLPVQGRPILWYALNSLHGTGLRVPIIALAYKADLIQAYFEQDNVEFRRFPNKTMAEVVFEVSENDDSQAFLGMSSDVLIPGKAVSEILDDYLSNGLKDTVLFTRLPEPGHKSWEFIVTNNHLQDVLRRDTRTDYERVLLILRKESLQQARGLLGNPVRDQNVPDFLQGFQTGWIMLLKTLLHMGIPVFSRIVDTPVCNINVPRDLDSANEFVKQHMKP